MTARSLAAVILVSTTTSIGSVWGYEKYQQSQSLAANYSSSVQTNARYTGFKENTIEGPMIDFEKAASKAAPAVVHIKTLTKAKQVSGGQGNQSNPFRDLFGDGFGEMMPEGHPGSRDQRASGSGVIITADGYIVTNNHVIDEADEVMVTLNNKKDFKAKVIGRDASTDLAVIKIEATHLPVLTFANSENIHLGQWVLAIGYPLNLETTVTSGIVSAKSRSLGINSRQSKTPVESFIQTDAAVNPGNSGGALVNTDGNIIGINSAIASPTGSYAGYAYAIPSNLVQKVVNDIIKFGSTQRAYLGVMFGSDQMSEEERGKNNIKEGEGVFVMDVSKGSAAESAGVQKGDFITKINGRIVNTGTEMVEQISVLHPGDKVSLSYAHNGSEKNTSATLKGATGTYESIKEQVVDQLGATFENLDKGTADKLNLQGGVTVKTLNKGVLTDQTRIKEGFIITKVNNTKVNSVEALKQAIKEAGNTAVISGVYAGQPQTEYQYALNDLNSEE